MAPTRTRADICAIIFVAIALKDKGPSYFGDVTYDELLRVIAPEIKSCPVCGHEIGTNFECCTCGNWLEIMVRLECQEGPNPTLEDKADIESTVDAAELIAVVNQAVGNEHQMRKFQEECCEASAAVNRFLNGRDDSYDALASEFADVLIVSAAMRLMLMRAKPGLVEKKLSEKFRRLRDRINHYLMHGGLKP